MKENNVTILSEEEIQPYLDYINETYGRHYLEQFRTKR